MPLIPVPIGGGGVRMSSKLSRWLFDITNGRHERNYSEFSVAGFIFTYVRIYFSGPFTGGDCPPPSGSAADCTVHSSGSWDEAAFCMTRGLVHTDASIRRSVSIVGPRTAPKRV